MQLTAQSVKISSSCDLDHWGGSFSENGLFILLETKGSTAVNAQIKGKEILDAILTKITNYKERNLGVIRELTEWAKKLDGIETLIFGLLRDDVIYLSNIGEGKVLLIRNGKEGSILAANETSSGKILCNDRVVFLSKTYLKCVGIDKQREILGEENISDAGELASATLETTENSSGATVLILRFDYSKTEVAIPVSPGDIKIKHYQEFIREKLQKFLLRIRSKTNEIDENSEEAKSKKTLLTIAIILTLLLVSSIFFNINNSQNANKQKLLKETLDLVSHQYDEAASLIDLNPGRARTLLSDSKLSLMQIFKNFPKDSKEYKDINEWLMKIAAEEVMAYKIYKFTSVPVFFDINLIKNGGIGSKIAIHQNTAAILDTKNQTVYFLSLDNKQSGIIAGSDVVKNAQTVAVHGKSAYILNSGGIVQIDISSKTSRPIVKTDKDWGDINDLVAFAGNLYLLDRKNGAIWKYIALESGFSARANYLNPDVKVSFANAGKIVIDGSVWMLADPATILKFTNGRGEPFAFTGLADTISGISTVYTNDDDKNLYILDKHSQRILVFDKEGSYQSQYQWEELKNADDIAVKEDTQKIFVLAGSKIYAIDIK